MSSKRYRSYEIYPDEAGHYTVYKLDRGNRQESATLFDLKDVCDWIKREEGEQP